VGVGRGARYRGRFGELRIKVKVIIKINIKYKSSGQECPLHTCRSD